MHSLQELKFYYKFLHNLLPVNLQNWQINTSIGVHNHNTRRQNEIYNVRINHYFAGKCLRHNLTKTINTTSNNVKEKLYTHSLRGFANYAKYVLIANYSVQCALLNCYNYMHWCTMLTHTHENAHSPATHCTCAHTSIHSNIHSRARARARTRTHTHTHTSSLKQPASFFPHCRILLILLCLICSRGRTSIN